MSAQELARLDSVCLEFESKLREGNEISIEQFVRQYGGPHKEVLRNELDAIRAEIKSGQKSLYSDRAPQERAATIKLAPTASPDDLALGAWGSCWMPSTPGWNVEWPSRC